MLLSTGYALSGGPGALERGVVLPAPLVRHVRAEGCCWHHQHYPFAHNNTGKEHDAVVGGSVWEYLRSRYLYSHTLQLHDYHHYSLPTLLRSSMFTTVMQEYYIVLHTRWVPTCTVMMVMPLNSLVFTKSIGQYLLMNVHQVLTYSTFTHQTISTHDMKIQSVLSDLLFNTDSQCWLDAMRSIISMWCSAMLV